MIEVATYSDRYFLDVVSLVENFHKEAVHEYDQLLEVNQIIETIKFHKDHNSENCFLLIIDGVCQGILFGITTKSFLNAGELFQEIIWYVNKKYRKYGIKLLRFAENILKERNCKIIIMAVLENSKTEKLHRFYERLGYKKMETHFVRNL